MRILICVPLVFSIIGFILSLLSLFAGNNPGFMEDYHVITLNTSMLGNDLIPSPTSSAPSSALPTSIDDFFNDITGDISGAIGDTVAGGLNAIVGEAIDQIKKELGVKDWYSLHALSTCMGNYTPDAGAKGAEKNITECPSITDAFALDLGDQNLKIGTLEFNISSITSNKGLERAINDVTVIIAAMLVIFCIGMAAAGLEIIASLFAIFRQPSRVITLTNLSISSVSFSLLFLATLAISVLQNELTIILNGLANGIGLFVYKGGKYLALTWVAVTFMFLVSVMWATVFYLEKREEKNEKGKKEDYHVENGDGRSEDVAEKGSRKQSKGILGWRLERRDERDPIRSFEHDLRSDEFELRASDDAGGYGARRRSEMQRESMARRRSSSQRGGDASKGNAARRTIVV